MKTNSSIIFTIFFIITAGCASTVPEPKLMPEKSEYVFPFFVKGQPIAAVESANAFMLMSLEPTVLSGIRYFRLWILYQNISGEAYLLEPQRFASLTATSISKAKSGKSSPESPTKILANISNDKAIMMIMQAIGGTLKEMSVRPTFMETRFNDGSSATTTIYDQQEKREKIADRTSNTMANTALWYEIYQNSISDGILRRNTVFPGQSVNGYIYFPFPVTSSHGYTGRDPATNADYFIRIDLDLQGTIQSIYFAPIEGE